MRLIRVCGRRLSVEPDIGNTYTDGVRFFVLNTMFTHSERGVGYIDIVESRFIGVKLCGSYEFPR